ncbi:hypothetical protein OF83DRAFT_1179399, partial [Amylostereum chailletii]
ARSPIVLQVALSRDADEDGDANTVDTSAVAPYFPGKKMVNWWAVVGGAEHAQTHLNLHRNSKRRCKILQELLTDASVVRTSGF